VRALIVDDSPVVRVLLERMLERYGECVSVADGERAIAVYSRRLGEDAPFELVCLDLGLNGMPGTDVLRKIREVETARSPVFKSRVLVVTSSSAVTDVDAVRREGADGYIVKPIDEAKLSEYLVAFGFRRTSEGKEPAETAINSLESMCDQDAIPATVLARLIQRMACSISRQLPTVSAQALSLIVGETPEVVGCAPAMNVAGGPPAEVLQETLLA